MTERIRTLIVDDERYSREELGYLLGQYPSVELVGEAESGEQAVMKAIQLQPDVVFLDVEMPIMNGLQAAEAMMKMKSPPKIVFATAYPQFGVDAFQVEALDYLLKPIDEERMAETVKRLERTILAPRQELSSPVQIKSCGKLSIEEEGEIHFIDPDDIIYLSREESYTKIVTVHQVHHVRTPLKNLEAKLRLYPFFRIHKSYMVHMKYVKRLVPWFNGAYQLELKGSNELLAVSRNYAKAFREAMEL
ncbi:MULTISPECIES: LytTR family DNA-binding domain-containing protein [unclassified Paenibacillus]|uniref:LytR/AlgR family response regulator transcription factor n=1 Tax=Paenibacillus provencensis TaxID=441151 RepID=A0ABW3PXQ6_9BACL|nr:MULTISPECIES: LytTR family DNA-binding domain-containing protein [unclassified Paenibacillus]MCM3126156.1 LytTR family DNA-binding domain-containing protein [Paenibacillus sp. MER 78]SFS61771.1 two component transcriptional regulator, LytTR family [Paenibacillus sp. 453mf]